MPLQLIDELLPVVPGAPNLGGHNRSGESIKATKAKQKMQQLQPGSDAAALARRSGTFPGNVAQVPNAEAMHTSMAPPQAAAWEQAPLLVQVGDHISSSNLLICVAASVCLCLSAWGSSSCCVLPLSPCLCSCLVQKIGTLHVQMK